MKTLPEIKRYFIELQEALFKTEDILDNSFQFSVKYSIEIENIIRELVSPELKDIVISSCGSFSRRELSPYSDIDIMFIIPQGGNFYKEIQNFVTSLWDVGMEVSHTIRETSDIKKFFHEDLHTFTQFFEIRFIAGSHKLFLEWKNEIFRFLEPSLHGRIIGELLDDSDLRYKKYGSSPKVIEPNVKLSAGGLRDLQLIEWIYIIKTGELLNKQVEATQAEIFIDIIQRDNLTSVGECNRLLNGYSYILGIRHLLHLLHGQKNDRLEFDDQVKISKMLHLKKDGYRKLMKNYFEASNVIRRFTESYSKSAQSSLPSSLPDIIAIELDEEFYIKGKTIYYKGPPLKMSSILRGFYYRGFHSAYFDEKLRMQIIETLDDISDEGEQESSVFFREILKLSGNVGITLSVMNELGVLEKFLPEFGEMVGFIQHGVYHSYTADEHTLITIQNVESLANEISDLGRIYNSITRKEILNLALLFHDIAKPINLTGHEIIGAEIASSVLYRLGYSDEEIDNVVFLVRNHLFMEQIAFRRNLNEPDTLNNFISRIKNSEQLNMLYLLTYADLSAVNPALMTTWKKDLLRELYEKAIVILTEQISAEDLLYNSSNDHSLNIIKKSSFISEDDIREHMESINDNNNYFANFSGEEIAKHIEQINSGAPVSVIFNESENFTNITVITIDTPFLLSKLCGVLSINDLNIHDAKVFTRKDGIVIDSFNVTDFRTHTKVERERYPQILDSFNMIVSGLLQINTEISKMKSKWWRIETRFFKRPGNVVIKFEETEKYTIIDIFSPDRLGFLYMVTRKMNELGLNIHFAKIATKSDEIVDSFYVLDRNGKKVSENYYPFIETELTEAIKQIL
ncbi:MAG: HD domain-containing protein [Ignavibacteriales bacterium]|jgi:[protein-PII] uridylyltransferase|nr:HD domain-containing protein [Ignavibacteriaceae bacterium]NLH62261.1 HD domain-containing protein [Ignavibacteriales bacterium]HOJ16948.1 HD domain-containing protein [Ignavibacteriaceae bacterium]HPO56687.1 HD domain-containing protein [Ignavibacteriaceae bacterium]